MVSFASPKTLEEFRIAQTDKTFRFAPEIHTLQFLAPLLEIFGVRYKDAIQKQLNSQAQNPFDAVYWSFITIQQGFETGADPKKIKKMERVQQVLKICSSEKVHSDRPFFQLIEKSYGILQFSQRILLRYKTVDKSQLERIEAAKKKAFRYLDQSLQPKSLEESKTEPSFHKPLEDPLSLTQLYFGTGALVCQGRMHYFSDLIRGWVGSDPSRRAQHEKLLEQLPGRNWVEDVMLVNADFPRYANLEPHWSFRDFLTQTSIDSLEEHIKLKFSPFVRKEIAVQFKSEEVRSDVCYFTADPSRFYELRLPFDRGSTQLVRAIQLFLFINNRCGVLKNDQEKNELLAVLLFISPSWKEKNLPNFQQRSSIQEDVLPSDAIDAFYFAWKGLGTILEATYGPEKELFYKDSNCWELLLFLWDHPHRTAFVTTIVTLARIPRFSMTLKAILAFCRENKETLTMETGDVFVRGYENILEQLEKSGCKIAKPQYIFFDDPPVNIGSIQDFQKARFDTARFASQMIPYRFIKEKDFCSMLRRYIFDPNCSEVLFHLLEDTRDIGGFLSEELLSDVFLQNDDPVELPSPDVRGRAKAFAKTIQDLYEFSEVQIFSLYQEFIRVLMGPEKDVIQKISCVISELVALCPFIRKQDIYFLFRYHPTISPDQVDELARMREKWAKSEERINKFIIDQSFYQDIIQKTKDFVSRLARACQNENVADMFQATCHSSLLSAFFPPLQPLTDYFRITNVTAEGIRWGEPVWETHLGQLKFILGEASVGIYLNWMVMNDSPTLFLSFFNLKEGNAHSAFVSVKITNKIPEEKEKPFYGLLSRLNQFVLGEGVEAELAPGVPETPASWAFCFGASDLIREYSDIQEYIDPIWLFLKEVKIAYRTLFLSSVAKRRIPAFRSYEPQKVAALGHIFHFAGTRSLLPESIFITEPHKEWYLSNAPELNNYPSLFSFSTKRQPLNLSIQFPPDKELSVHYQVQTIEDLVGKEFNKKNEVAFKETDGRYVSLSVEDTIIPLRYPKKALDEPNLFKVYFEYHLLILKAALFKSQSLVE